MASLKSARYLEERLNDHPDSLVFSRVAELYRKAGKVDRAIAMCEKGVEKNPEYITGLLVLSRCYLQKKQLDDAADTLMNVCRMDWRNLAGIRMLAHTLQLQGSPEKAADLYAFLLKLDPGDRIAGRNASKTGEPQSIDLLEIIGEVPAAPKAAGRDARFSAEETLRYDQKAQAAAEPEASFEPPAVTGGPAPSTVAAPAESASEDMLTDATVISGADVTDRISSLFGEGPSLPKAKTAAPVPPPPPEKKLPGFEAQPYIEATTVTSDREDILGKDTIKMPAIKEPRTGEVELEETMIMDASEAMLPKGDSGIRIKDAGSPLMPPARKEADRGFEQADLSAVQELAGEKSAESLDDIVQEMTKTQASEPSVEEAMEAEVFEPQKEPEAAVKPDISAEDTISGDDVFARLEGIFNKDKKKHEKEPAKAKGKDYVPEVTEISPASAVTGGKEDAEKTAALPTPDDTISGDDIFNRIDGIFTEEKKEKQGAGPAEEPKGVKLDKKEETDTFRRPELIKDAGEDEGPERTAVELPGTSAQGDEGFEETLIFETPSDIGGSKKDTNQARLDKEDTLSLSETIGAAGAEGREKGKEDTLSLSETISAAGAESREKGKEDTLSLSETISATKAGDTDIDRKAPEPEKTKVDDGKESTAVFEDFKPGPSPETPPVVPVFEKKPETPAAADITASIDKKDNPDDLPDQVLSPTLANIYLEQGQPQFALKIYQRLSAKDPANEELKRKIDELKKDIAKGADTVRPPRPKRGKARKKTPPPKSAASKPDDSKIILPLAGVRLRKRLKMKRSRRPSKRRE